MRLVVLRNEAMVADVVCGREAIYIGSRDTCRVHIPDARVPAQHAVVYSDADNAWRLELVDLSCELRVNSDAVAHQAPLKSGDEIQILDYVVRVFPEYEESPMARVSLGTSRAQLERFAQAKLPASAILRKADEPLNIQASQLSGLGRASVAVSGCVTIEQLMDAALRCLLTAFAAQRAWIGLRRPTSGPMEYEEGRLLTGQLVDMPPLGKDLKPRVLDRGQYVLVPRVSREDRTSLLSGPLLGPDGTLGMVYVDRGASGRRFDQRDLEYFVLHLNAFAYQLDSIFKLTARTKAAMVDGLVSVAHEIQARLTPRKLPQWDGDLGFGAFREPGRQRSGNIYDVVRLANNLAGFMLAHTPATGMLPTLLMVQAQTAFRSAVMHQDNPAKCLRMLNWMLHDGEPDHPVECFVGVVDPASGQVSYSLAGHVGAYIISPRGEARALAPSPPSEPAGVTKHTAYALLPEQLERGETLVLFTPGVVTAKNRQDEVFGEERFINLLCDGFGQLASNMLKEMLTELRNFTEGGQQPDDITVILAHRV